MWTFALDPLFCCVAQRRRLRFEAQAKSLRQHQLDVLLAKLRPNADSAFGREHHFDRIRTVDDFRRTVPLSTYHTMLPRIEKVIAGDQRQLLGPDRKVCFVARTSGTTGQSKLVPVTKEFVREYRLGWWVWAAYVRRDYPPILKHRILHLTASESDEKTPQGIPCGSITGLIARMQPAYVRNLYAAPPVISRIMNDTTKYYVAMRFAATRNVSMLITACPGTLLSVARAGLEHHESIIRDVRDGTVTFFDEPDPPLAREIRALSKPNPRAAKRLEDVRRRAGALLPKDIWPHLSLVACWKGGPSQNYLPRFAEPFGSTPVRDIGLLASEGRMTIPISSQGSAGVLDLTSHFYEFIPLEDSPADNPPTLLAHELDIGHSYRLVFTTSAGLYRYNIDDIVKVVDVFHQAPVLEFQNKGAGMTSLTGEKLSEFQVVCAVKEASPDPASPIHTCTLAPRWGDPPFYAVLVETADLDDRAETDFLSRLDNAIRKLNIAYDSARLGRLGPPRLHRLPTGAWQQYRRLKIQQNRGHLDQLKHVFLEQDLHFVEKLHQSLGIAAETPAARSPDTRNPAPAP